MLKKIELRPHSSIRLCWLIFTRVTTELMKVDDIGRWKDLRDQGMTMNVPRVGI